MPRWRADTFWASGDRSLFAGVDATLAHTKQGGKAAVLFVDTFNGTFESESAWAATRVLKAAGYILHTLAKDGGHYCCVSEGSPNYGVEPSAKGKASLCLFQTDENPTHLHLAFTAENRRQADTFHRAALQAGGKDNGAPGLRPNYHANYYAAFVIDPDGHDIEVACHVPEA